MATYIRLADYKSSDGKEQEFFNPENRYEAKQSSRAFKKAGEEVVQSVTFVLEKNI